MHFRLKRNRRGFSYIEILITIMILAVFFLPTMDMFSRSVSHLAYVGEMNTALALARETMERFRNLRLSEAQREARGDMYTPPLDKGPLEINGGRWRTLQHIHEKTDPLAVDVFVYKDEFFDAPLVQISTLFEDVE